VLCGQYADETLCDGCRVQFFINQQRRCRSCAMPLPHHDVDRPRCGECIRLPPAFDTCIVAGNYVAPVDQLVLSLKFGGQLALAPLMARLLADALLRVKGEIDTALPSLLMPVPLSQKRLQMRGFNQTLEIARPLARLTGIPLVPQLMRRNRETMPQSLLSPDQRRSNIEGAFDLSPNYENSLRGEHLGVIDDVITTGQTLNEIALTLNATVRSVSPIWYLPAHCGNLRAHIGRRFCFTSYW
jgi:ComF family protein